MWDGQNLFDDATSYSGEWHVDEICDAMIRLGEQSPWPCPSHDASGEGQIGRERPEDKAERKRVG